MMAGMSLYNGRIRGAMSARVFANSNRTELDVSQYIAEERLEVLSTCSADEYEVLERDAIDSGSGRRGCFR
jgi:hypothetical protein